MRLVRITLAAVLPLAMSCRAPVEPIPSHLRLSTDCPGITIVLHASRAVLALGDTMTFTVTAHNATDERVQVGFQCGPSLDVRVRSPERTYTSALIDQFADSEVLVAFTCELGPGHFAQPRDSLVNRIPWKARSRGNHVAIGGARGNDGLLDPSQPLTITVK